MARHRDPCLPILDGRQEPQIVPGIFEDPCAVSLVEPTFILPSRLASSEVAKQDVYSLCQPIEHVPVPAAERPHSID